jgi:hypothetical protein
MGGMVMKKKVIGSILLALLLTTALGCSKKASKQEMSGTGSTKSSVAMDSASNRAEKPSAPAPASLAKSDSKSYGETLVTTSKKVIQIGEIRIVVEDLKKVSLDVRSKIDEVGGYIESESLNEYNSTARLRIPSQKLDDFVGYVEKSYQVESKNTSAQDVTSAYVDNEARLNNFKVQEAQTQEIMKKANTVEEILKVQNELFKVRAEIEALEARKKTWDRDVDFSTITLFANKKQIAIESKLKFLTGSEFFKSMGKGFNESTTRIILSIQNLVIFVISNIIMLSFLGVVGYFVYTKLIRGKLKL